LNRTIGIGACLCCLAAMLAAAATAPAHQTAYSKGVSVTLHVNPNDEPDAGRPAQVIVTRVAPNRGSFRWRSCACYLRVSDSSGHVVVNRRTGRRSTVTFPRSGAYEIVFSGRYKRAGHTKRFRAKFAIRAN
jgi:hypothetical protein